MHENKKKNAGVVFRFVRGNLWLFGLGLLCSMLNTAFNAMTPQIIRMTVDSIVGEGSLPNWVERLGLGAMVRSDPGKMLLLAAAGVLVTAMLSGLFSLFARLHQGAA